MIPSSSSAESAQHRRAHGIALRWATASCVCFGLIACDRHTAANFPTRSAHVDEERRAVAPLRSAPGLRMQATVEQTNVAMPALSSTMTEGKIVQWTKQVGDKVSAGDILMVVESDKADMDVESFEDGYIAAILVDDGESAAVGATVAIIVPNE